MTSRSRGAASHLPIRDPTLSGRHAKSLPAITARRRRDPRLSRHPLPAPPCPTVEVTVVDVVAGDVLVAELVADVPVVGDPVADVVGPPVIGTRLKGTESEPAPPNTGRLASTPVTAIAAATRTSTTTATTRDRRSRRGRVRVRSRARGFAGSTPAAPVGPPLTEELVVGLRGPVVLQPPGQRRAWLVLRHRPNLV